MGDELRILRDRLVLVEQIKPSWSSRLERLLAACERLAGIVPETRLTGIHRDFYPAQVLVHGRELYFLDFDLFCHGNPALDVGNFLGHLTEQGLRTLGSPEALQDRESALAERFLELSGEGLRTGVQAYHTLTLVRHIYLSTQFRERIPFNEALLHLCEERLARVR
jgi:Ser/Thr protein kinase RdoA (MazF antagonist)